MSSNSQSTTESGNTPAPVRQGFLEKTLVGIHDNYFAEGKKLHRLWPLFDSIYTVVLAPVHATRRAPFVRDNLDLKRYMFMVILALHPAIFFGIYNNGLQAMGQGDHAFMDVFLKGLLIFLPILVISYAVGLFWEFVFTIIKKEPISEGYLVSGLLIALIMPPTVPLWIMVIGITFGVILGKEVFGGTGMNILNPALTVRAFLYFTYPQALSGDVWVANKGYLLDFLEPVLGIAPPGPAISGATPLGVAAQLPAGQSVVDAFLSYGWDFNTLLVGTYPGSIGESSFIAIALGAVLLLATRIASWRTILMTFVGAWVTGWIFNQFGNPENGYHQLAPHFHFLIGGFMFGAIFMTTDPVSSPATNSAKYVYGFFIGALTVLVRVANPAYPEGIMLAILFMNIFAPTLDYFVVQSRLKRRARYAR